MFVCVDPGWNSQRLSDRRRRPTCDPAPAAQALSGSLSFRKDVPTNLDMLMGVSRRGAAAVRRFRSVDVKVDRGRGPPFADLKMKSSGRPMYVRALDVLCSINGHHRNFACRLIADQYGVSAARGRVLVLRKHR